MITFFIHLFCCLAGYLILWRIATLPKPGDDSGEETLSVVIPARNESERLPLLLSSLKDQSHPPLEILVVDDHSTDDTAALAGSLGAQVIASAPLPKGWRGKTWACHQGGHAAQGKWILFLDADVTLRRTALGQILAACQKSNGAVSILPYHRTIRMVEDLSAFFNLVQAAASNAFTFRGPRSKHKRLFGPVLAVNKETFLRVGGYEPVKDRWVENFDLAEHFDKQGIPMACYGGKGSVEFRMYAGGLGEMTAGWAKSFAMGGKGTPLFIWICWSLWLGGPWERPGRSSRLWFIGTRSRCCGPPSATLFCRSNIWMA
ncbi:MAG: glycosyltransferase [Elusimicrobia bacterium]|nr:glycosyltransferase [Elusimicrobiota bacterium]